MSVRVRVFLAMITIVAILAAVNLSIILFFIQRPLSMAVGGNISSAILPVEGSSRHIEPHSINAAAIFLAFGVLTAIIASGELSKPLMRMEKKNFLLDELSRTAASTSEAKSWFIANMRHEMRKPLNSVVRISEHMLGREGIRGEARDGIEKIHNAGMTILGIVNDILDISKIESQKFEIMPIEYDVPSLINDVVALNTVRAGDKPVEFNLHIDESLPCKLFGDELRVELICNNLLSNAFKYTRRGRIDLFLGCEKEGDNEWLTVRVADTGIGIRDEEMENLFSSRKRRHDEFSGKTDWTSLSITKMIVSMMGGTIMAKSEFGKGSIFTVSLRQGFVTDTPIGGDVAENLKRFHWSGNRRTENARPERARMFPPARVLVVDDVQANLEIAKELLESSGMRVDCLISGWQAVERIREGRIVYDAIFMDYMMPGMDGIEAARVIREEIGTEYAQNIPIIALSANSAIGNEKNFLERGFQAFLPKPIDVIQLDYAITKWLRDGALEREYIENQVSGGQGDDVLPPIGSCASWRPAESVPQSA